MWASTTMSFSEQERKKHRTSRSKAMSSSNRILTLGRITLDLSWQTRIRTFLSKHILMANSSNIARGSIKTHKRAQLPTSTCNESQTERAWRNEWRRATSTWPSRPCRTTSGSSACPRSRLTPRPSPRRPRKGAPPSSPCPTQAL